MPVLSLDCDTVFLYHLNHDYNPLDTPSKDKETFSDPVSLEKQTSLRNQNRLDVLYVDRHSNNEAFIWIRIITMTKNKITVLE